LIFNKSTHSDSLIKILCLNVLVKHLGIR
jgi:hypothetical protein